MREIVIALAGTALMASAAGAREAKMAVTIYNGNLGLVKDVRTVEVKQGSTEFRFDDVAAQIDPTSVHFLALDHPDQVVLTEQNFQYDLADPDRLLSRFLNRPVTAILKDGSSQAGTLLSFDPGNLVLRSEGGSVSLVQRLEVKNVSLGELPGGLVVKPTLVWNLESGRSGTERVEVSYLTSGINWHAEYVAVVNDKDTALDLTGWVSIDNQSGATYENAKLKLVAGDVNRARPEFDPRPMMAMDGVRTSMAAPKFEEESFFEYHLYTLDRPATVRDRETKQLSLFPSAAAKVMKKLTYDGARDAKKVSVSLEMQNSKANGLGLALPKGVVRVYKKGSDGAQEFIGEDRIDHTPTNETVRLTMGTAFDIVGERTQTDFQRIDDRVAKMSIKVEIRNHKKEAIEVNVIEHLQGDWDVTAKSQDFVKKDAHTIEFPVKVAADGTAVVTYTARYRY